MFEETCEKYGYVFKNNILAFQKGPISQWWGGFKGQEGGFESIVPYVSDVTSHRFNCCEQYMMFRKAILFLDEKVAKDVLNTTQPSKQKDLGRTVSNFNQEKWDIGKYKIVLEANYRKFRDSKNELFREFMKSIPKFAIIVEAAPWDKIWGNGLPPDDDMCFDITKWQGQNLLGKALMEVRDKLC